MNHVTFKLDSLMCFISVSALCTALYPNHYERLSLNLLLKLTSARKVAKIRYVKQNIFLSTASLESPKKGATFCFGLEAISNVPETQSILTSEGDGQPVFHSMPGSPGSFGRSRTHRQAEEAH